MRMIQRDLHQQLRTEALAARQRVADLVRPLDPAQLQEHPEAQRWSVAEVLEHLCVTHEASSAPAVVAARAARPDAGAPAREWRPSFLGNLIASSLAKPRPLKAPKLFRPGLTARNGVLEAFLSHETDFVNAMDDAGTLDWLAVRVGSPALPRWAPKMNLGDGFRIHVVHVVRHTKQIERAISKL